MGDARTCSCTGSSPRMRGKPSSWLTQAIWPGLIPAHAGKTCSKLLPARCDRAHPRACGENCFVSVDAEGDAGSSPRMRGKPKAGMPIAAKVRLIPAHAGKTSLSEGWEIRSAAHPRACGENTPPAWLATWSAGSSPRMRGKQTASQHHSTY